MNLEDAKLLAPVIETVDGGCGYCIQDFCDKINLVFTNLHFYRDDDDRVLVNIVEHQT